MAEPPEDRPPDPGETADREDPEKAGAAPESDGVGLIDSLRKRASQGLEEASRWSRRYASDLSETAQGYYKDSALQKGVDSVDAEMDRRGIYKTAGEAKELVGRRVDEVTGRRLLELLEARLARQDVYNDTLATRLAETMGRVAELEATVAELKKRR